MSRKANTELQEFLKNPTMENYNKVAGGLELPANVGSPQVVIPEGKEVVQLPGLLNRIRGTKVITDKDRPEGIFRMVAGIRDAFSGQKTDFDKLGGGIDETGAYDKFAGVTKVDDNLEKKFSPVQAKRIERYLKDELEEPKTALEEAEEGLDFYEKNYGRIAGLNRKLRKDAAIDATLQYAATEPLRQAFLNRAADRAAQRGLRIRGALEAMPSNIQNIMLSKQAQAATASSAEAERARAAADQQDAATRFAGLGMQRRFG
jgi:hypothetical protein|tara:strand:- start:7 stop:789 length:783 start_codon:yes stop_codon:yes gene_type:complete